MAVTVLQRIASTQQIGLLLVPAIKGAVNINTHCNYSQPELTKLNNENIGGHPYTFTQTSRILPKPVDDFRNDSVIVPDTRLVDAHHTQFRRNSCNSFLLSIRLFLSPPFFSNPSTAFPLALSTLPCSLHYTFPLPLRSGPLKTLNPGGVMGRAVSSPTESGAEP